MSTGCQKDRQRDRQTARQTDRKTDRKAERKTERFFSLLIKTMQQLQLTARGDNIAPSLFTHTTTKCLAGNRL